ncbi:MAG: hypothetical protein AB1466_00005 [Actinomycetota bacterium]
MQWIFNIYPEKGTTQEVIAALQKTKNFNFVHQFVGGSRRPIIALTMANVSYDSYNTLLSLLDSLPISDWEVLERTEPLAPRKGR